MRSPRRTRTADAFGWMALLAFCSVSALAQAPPPARIGYQGVVRDAAGAPLDGATTMAFRLYDDPAVGNLLWEEVYDPSAHPPQVTVTRGLFSVALGDPAHRSGGSETPFPGVFANHENVYLGVAVGEDVEMTPRVKVSASPYAVNAATLEGRAGATFANAAHTHAGTDVTSAVSAAADADTLDGQHAAGFLNTSSVAQTKSGTLHLDVSGDMGLDARGAPAGYFTASFGGGYATVGSGDTGILAFGPSAGGYFQDSDSGSYTYVGNEGWGLKAYGNGAGGFFQDFYGAYASVATAGYYKITGSGTAAFVQNHPDRKDRVIVYACPEGDEVATYTRGTAKLVNGEARVRLGDTFRWVTNPDIGLTAHLTPVGEWSDLYVARKSTTELVVRSRGGAREAAFDYLVYGLRIGFEELAIVQEKQRESYIPSSGAIRELYSKHPELRAFNALERFKAMEADRRGVRPEELDLGRAKALKEAIHEYDPAVDPPLYELPGHGPGPMPTAPAGMRASAGATSGKSAPAPAVPRSSMEDGSRPAASDAPAASPSGAPPTPSTAERLPASKNVAAGDVLVMIPSNGAALHPCAKAADPMVVGIALQDPQDGAAPVATSGTAFVKADASQAPIDKGDLLVTSPLSGHAMKAPRPAEQGTVIGKALEPLESGTGVIRVLVMLR